jgi:hydrogenase maturation protease
MTKTIVLGMGNTLKCDDGVGIRIALNVRQVMTREDVDVVPFHVAGFRLVESLEGYDRAIIVDAVLSGEHVPGTAFWVEYDKLRHGRSDRSLHDLHIADALELGKKYGMKMPDSVSILAIEVEDIKTWSESLTPAVERAIQAATEMIIEHLTE